MLIRHLDDCPEITAGDRSRLREILTPAKHAVGTGYSLAWAYVRPGERTRLHRLTCSEVYYILKGSGTIHINNEETRVAAHDTIYIPAHALQCIENHGPGRLEFLCIVEPAWQPPCEEVLE